MSRLCALAHQGCEHEVGDNSKHELCQSCRARYRVWKKKGMGAALAWKGRVRFWSLRMEEFFPDKRERTVTERRTNGHRRPKHVEHRA